MLDSSSLNSIECNVNEFWLFRPSIHLWSSQREILDRKKKTCLERFYISGVQWAELMWNGKHPINGCFSGFCGKLTKRFDLQTVWVEIEISESRTEGLKQQGRFVCRSSLSRLYIGHLISILLGGVVVWDDRGLSARLSAVWAEEMDR